MINRIDCGKTMSRATEHNGVIYFGGHVAAGKQIASSILCYNSVLENWQIKNSIASFTTLSYQQATSERIRKCTLHACYKRAILISSLENKKFQ